MKNSNKIYKEIIVNILCLLVGILVANIYQEVHGSDYVYSLNREVIYSEACECGKDIDLLKNKFKSYQLNGGEELLMLFMYKYSGNKENGFNTDVVDDENFRTLSLDYLERFKSSPNYKKNMEFIEYVYKTYLPKEYEDFKRREI